MTTPMVLPRPVDPISQGGIRLRRITRAVVGRSTEIAAVEEAIEDARHGIAGLSLEGEPGIGKSRLLLAAAEVARAHGFAPVMVSGDEELRGPFMLARSLLGSDALREGAGESTVAALDRACDILAGQDDPTLAGMAPGDRLLRVIDQATLALRTAALERPIALLLDDMQWSDQDSLRLLRYLIRTQPSLPIFVAIAIRPEESALTTELVTLLADMDRMGLVRRLHVGRFRQPETAELLRQTLGGKIAPETVAAMHGQAEGVPFVIEELVRTYREAGLIQFVDGSWTLSPKAGRLVPSSVRTLVQRRAARLPDDTRNALAEAAIVGRSFRLADVCAIRAELDQRDCQASAVAEVLAPAIEAGLIAAADERSGADFNFSHQQVHEFAASWLPPPRRRAIHAAIVDLLSVGVEPTPAMLPILARHALAAEDIERSARFSVEAAAGALRMSAPEEALRLVDDALAVVSTRSDRVALLRTRDDAYDMLRRVDDRLEGLTELAALAEAAGDAPLQREVMLRRASALRVDEEPDRASDLAREVRRLAAADGDLGNELAACLELGQDLMRAPLGEAFAPTPHDVDFDAAQEPFERAVSIAEELGDMPRLAAALRELGVLNVGRVRAWFVEGFQAGEHLDILRHVAAGGRLEDVLPTLPIAPMHHQALALLQRSLELFEASGDRRGAMSAVIALAYLSWAPDVHVGSSPARRIEEIRRLASRMRSLSRESDRAAAEAQMLYGVHVFSRAKVIPDLALARGREAYELARQLGERSLEFLAAGGTAMASIDLGDSGGANRWLDRAAAVATASPSPARSRQLELWRGLVAGSAGDLEGLHGHMRQALDKAASPDRRAARCEILAAYALQCARIGVERADPDLLTEAEQLANEAGRLVSDLPGHPPWSAQAAAATAIVLSSRYEHRRALELALTALAQRREALSEDANLEILLPAAQVVLALGDDAEQAVTRDELQLLGAMISQRTFDGDVRARWWKGPVGRELARLAGVGDTAVGHASDRPGYDGGPAGDALSADERRLLSLIVEGRTNAEIAEELGVSPELVTLTLAAMYSRMGASSRAEATVFALSGQV